MTLTPARWRDDSGDVDSFVAAGEEGRHEGQLIFDGDFESSGGAANFGGGVGVGAADAREPETAGETAGSHVLEARVGAVDGFDRSEVLDGLAIHPEEAVAGGMGKKEKASGAFRGGKSGLPGREMRRPGRQAESEDVPHVGGEFYRREDEEASALAEGDDFGRGPEAVVFGQADAVDATSAGEVNRLFGLHGAALGAREGVAVQVDDGHRGSFVL